MKKVAPGLYGPVLAMEAYARTHNDRRTFELIKIRASALNNCGYCLAMHTRDARAQGESEERIAALREGSIPADWNDSDLWSPAEAAALALTDEVTRLHPEGVAEATWTAAVEQWGNKGVAGLLSAIATINVWNRVAIPTGLEAADL